MPLTELQIDQAAVVSQAQADSLWKSFMEQYTGIFAPTEEVDYGEDEQNKAVKGLHELVGLSG